MEGKNKREERDRRKPTRRRLARSLRLPQTPVLSPAGGFELQSTQSMPPPLSPVLPSPPLPRSRPPSHLEHEHILGFVKNRQDGLPLRLRTHAPLGRHDCPQKRRPRGPARATRDARAKGARTKGERATDTRTRAKHAARRIDVCGAGNAAPALAIGGGVERANAGAAGGGGGSRRSRRSSLLPPPACSLSARARGKVDPPLSSLLDACTPPVPR